MGANGIALVEYIGDSDTPCTFTIEESDGSEKTFIFSSRPALKTQFMDKAHADYLIEQKSFDGGRLFAIIAQYASSAHKRRLELSVPSTVNVPDDLPSGFARERVKSDGVWT